MTAPASETPLTDALADAPCPLEFTFASWHINKYRWQCIRFERALTPILSRLSAIQHEGGTPHQLVLTQEEIAGLLKLNGEG